jgi:hypothetical protein
VLLKAEVLLVISFPIAIICGSSSVEFKREKTRAKFSGIPKQDSNSHFPLLDIAYIWPNVRFAGRRYRTVPTIDDPWTMMGSRKFVKTVVLLPGQPSPEAH